MGKLYHKEKDLLDKNDPHDVWEPRTGMFAKSTLMKQRFLEELVKTERAIIEEQQLMNVEAVAKSLACNCTVLFLSAD